MGNHVSIENDELLEYIIDGIPDVGLRDQARMQGFSSIDGLLKAFEKIALRDRGTMGSSREGEKRTTTADDKKKTYTDSKRCFNCCGRDHLGVNCPTKTLGVKCFECRERGHIATKCPKKNNSDSEKRTVVASISHVANKKYTREVVINDHRILALIDTGSDITIMRMSEYAKIEPPKMQTSCIEFCGIGGYSVKTLGEFQANISIDEHVYPIFIQVVPDTVLQYGLFIGADFIDTVDMNFKRGVISIAPVSEVTTNGEPRPEIFMINTVCNENSTDVNTSSIHDARHRQILTRLVENYFGL
ncbi:uncharacterized protein [Cardiocondyla obscurior]|uniref:uncharacterized protein n=1 Tax=Cardiocondyla obscurior TaxID=286306 RepID=UPI0039658782